MAPDTRTSGRTYRIHRDKTIELNGRSQDNTRYRAFPAPNCFYQPFDMSVRRFISSAQRRNLVSISKLSAIAALDTVYDAWHERGVEGGGKGKNKRQCAATVASRYANALFAKTRNWFNMLAHNGRRFAARAAFSRRITFAKSFDSAEKLRSRVFFHAPFQTTGRY